VSEDAATPGDPAEQDEANPVRKALDLFVFAPVGVALTVAEDLPGLVSKGRQRVEGQIRNAKVIGQFVVTQGQQDLTQRIGKLLHPEPASPDAPASADEAGPVAASAAAAEAPSETAVPPGAPTATPKPAPNPADTLIVEQALADYDTLSASQVVRRLESLGPDELRAVHRHEASHRNRRTILNRTNQLLGAGPPEAS
jgi:hypothetical protein